MANVFNLTGGGGGGNFTLQRIEITAQPKKTEYLAGDRFDPEGMTVIAYFGLENGVITSGPVTSYTVTPNPLEDGTTEVTVHYSELGTSVTATVKVTVIPRLTKITCTEPSKKTYEYGDQLQTSNIVVTAHYSNSKTKTVQGQFSPTTLNVVGTQTITVTYSEEKQTTQTTSFNVTVERKRVEKPTWKGPLTYNSQLQTCTSPTLWTNYNADYMTMGGVTSGTAADNYGATFTPKPNYQWKTSTFEEITVTWTIARQAITTKPTWIGNLTYDNTAKDASTASYWKDYDTTKMTISGSLTQTNAGSYDATFTPTSNYCWDDQSTKGIVVKWSIAKATGNLTPKTSTVNLSASTLAQTVAFNKNGSTGNLTNTTLTGVTITWDGTTIKIQGNGSTSISGQTITVTMADDGNHTQATATITVNATYWSFGAGTGEPADAAWFAGLKSYLASNNGASLKTTSGGSIVGATKTVTLSPAVLGTTSHLIVVIGVDQDGPNTVTWQTLNMLSNYTSYNSSSTNLKWAGSTAQTQCKAYYNAFPGKASIKQVNKGTCEATNNSRNGKATYSNEQVWLPSELEMGLDQYSSLKPSSATTTNAECTYGYKFSYSYYNSDTRRVKKQGDSGSANFYWERGAAQDGDYVCDVNSYGKAGSVHPTTSRGLAPAFVIG